MSVRGQAVVTMRYFPFFRAALYAMIALGTERLGAYAAVAAGMPAVAWVFRVFAALVLLQVFLLDVTTVSADSTCRMLRIARRIWWGGRVEIRSFAYEQVTAIIYRRTVSYKGEQQVIPGMRSWRMLVEIEETTEEPIFPDSAAIGRAEAMGNRLADAIGVPFRCETAVNRGAWVG